MSDYKINRNRPKLDKESVEASKDFSSVLNKVQATGVGVAKPFYKTKWFYLSSAVVVVAASMLLFGKFGHDNLSESKLNKGGIKNDIGLQEIRSIKPFQGDEYKFNNQVGAELAYKGEVKFSVEPNAFADSNDNIVQGEINLKYRELTQEIVSLVSMTYDSAGMRYSFLSPKIFEITALDKGGNELKITNGKTVKILFLSNEDGVKLYKLNTTNNKWVYGSNSKIAIPTIAKASGEEEKRLNRKLTPKEETELRFIEKEEGLQKEKINAITKKLPPPPRMANEKNYKFDLDVNQKEFPELAMYTNVSFEVDPSSKGFSSKMYSIEWDNAELKKKSNNDGVYSMVLQKGEVVKRFNVYPVVSPMDFEKAIGKYNETNKVELAKIKELKNAIKLNEKRKSVLLDSLNNVAHIEMENGIVPLWQEFSISTFGTYNCNAPQKILQ